MYYALQFWLLNCTAFEHINYHLYIDIHLFEAPSFAFQRHLDSIDLM